MMPFDIPGTARLTSAPIIWLNHLLETSRWAYIPVICPARPNSLRVITVSAAAFRHAWLPSSSPFSMVAKTLSPETPVFVLASAHDHQ